MKLVMMALLAITFIGCSSSEGFKRNKAPSGTGEKISGKINIQSYSDYRDAEVIMPNIRKECSQVNTNIAKSAKLNGKTRNINIVPVKKVNIKAKGNNVRVEILNAVSTGNAFVGHNKHMIVKAYLYKNGKLVDDIRVKRTSGGGMFAGFKGSCAVLNRISKKIGEDIAVWLKKYNK